MATTSATSAAIWTAAQTAAALPYPALANAIAELLRDDHVVVPPRLVQRLATGASLFVMPASDRQLAITKLITFVANNPAQGRPAIQGDIVVFDAATGARLRVLDGPTVTARRTAAVSLLATQWLLAEPSDCKLLIVGAGVQGRAHLDALIDTTQPTASQAPRSPVISEVLIASRTRASAEHLVEYARSRGLHAHVTTDPNAALADCRLVVTCTSATEIALRARPRDDALILAIGAFTPAMAEWAPEVCRHIAKTGRIVLDTRDADHEAGDLLQAQLPVTHYPTLANLAKESTSSPPDNTLRPHPESCGPILFKSCGWAGWDLAAARCAMQHPVPPCDA